MADFINTQTKALQRSRDASEVGAGWVVIPRATLEALETVPPYYRLVEHGVAREATPDEKGAIDAQRMPDLRAAKRRMLFEQANRHFESYYPNTQQVQALVLRSQAEAAGATDAVSSIDAITQFGMAVMAVYAAARDAADAATSPEELDDVVMTLPVPESVVDLAAIGLSLIGGE